MLTPSTSPLKITMLPKNLKQMLWLAALQAEIRITTGRLMWTGLLGPTSSHKSTEAANNLKHNTHEATIKLHDRPTVRSELSSPVVARPKTVE